LKIKTVVGPIRVNISVDQTLSTDSGVLRREYRRFVMRQRHMVARLVGAETLERVLYFSWLHDLHQRLLTMREDYACAEVFSVKFPWRKLGRLISKVEREIAHVVSLRPAPVSMPIVSA